MSKKRKQDEEAEAADTGDLTESGGDAITVLAAVARVTTLADGGVRWSFDPQEDTEVESAWLMRLKRCGHCANIVITDGGNGGQDGESSTDGARKIHI